MQFKDVKVKQVYYVDYEPHRKGEFDSNHLSIVLKKNKDKKTVIVIPLTSKGKGEGKNKMKIQISELPSRLSGVESYFVYDQVRTINTGRIEPIFDNYREIDVKVSDDAFKKIIKMATLELESKLTIDEKVNLYKEKLNDIYLEQIINAAYKLKNTEDEEKFKDLRNKIISLKYNIEEYKLTKKDLDSGIDKIIENISDLYYSKC